MKLKLKSVFQKLSAKTREQQKVVQTILIIDTLNLKTGKDLTLFHSKAEVTLLADKSENFI